MSRIIEHKELVIWRDARGKWQCRSTAAPSGMVYRSGGRSSGTERIRRRLWRRRDADDSPMPDSVIGNCGRPANEPCGLKEPSQCATHAKYPPIRTRSGCTG
jgi:hypothetical protein